MTWWRIGALAAMVATTQPNTGAAQALPDIALARPCAADAGCSYSWTTATRLGDMLAFAEKRFGPRDPAWTLLGVEFAETAAPQIWYPEFGHGYRSIVVQVTADAAADEKRVLFQMAHEVVHTLSPIGPDAKASVLEEGIATWTSLEYLRAADFQITPSYISDPNYEAAYWTIIELQAAQPDFSARIARWRSRGGDLSNVTARDMRAIFPNISAALAERLASRF